MQTERIVARHTETKELFSFEFPEGPQGSEPFALHVFLHFKGNRYIMLGTQLNGAEALVVYRSWNHWMDPEPEFWARPVSAWRELVKWPDGKLRPRFIPLRMCPYEGVLFRQVPGYVSGYGCPVCKGLSYHLPMEDPLP